VLLRAICFFVCVASLTGCGRAHLFYDTRELRHAPLQKDQYAGVDQVVVDKLGGRSVTWVDDDGKTVVVPAQLVPKRLGIAERGALWLALSTGDVGGENDVRVRVGKSSTPVSVYIALDGDVRVETGIRGERPDEPAPSSDDIRERFDLDGKIPGKWSDDELRALAQSLAMLAPAELAAVKDVNFDRESAPRDRDPTRAALFEMKGCRAVVYVYSSSVRADAFRFVGDARDPKPAVLHSILHEVGHAFEQNAAREKYCAAERSKDVAKANALIGAGNELTSASPVLAEYVRVLGGLPAPTDYGNQSAHESFAESFALFHVDPAALKRTRPLVHAWFARGGHLSSRDRS
jgi:hypothetical protein